MHNYNSTFSLSGGIVLSRLFAFLLVLVWASTAPATTPGGVTVTHSVTSSSFANSGVLSPIVIYDYDGLLANAGVSGSRVEAVIDYVAGDGLDIEDDHVVVELSSGQGASIGREIGFTVHDSRSAVLSVLVSVLVDGNEVAAFGSFEFLAGAPTGAVAISAAEATAREATRPRVLPTVGPAQDSESPGVPREILGCGKDVRCIPERLWPRSTK